MDCSLVTVRHVVGGYAARLRALRPRSASAGRCLACVVNLYRRIDSPTIFVDEPSFEEFATSYAKLVHVYIY